jgi:hypothetical protein
MTEPQSTSQKLNARQCTELAESFVDMVLDPANAWLRELFLIGSNLPADYIEFLGKKTGIKGRPADPRSEKKFFNALEKMDRSRLLALMKKEFELKPPTKEGAEALLRMFDKSLWKGAFQESARHFSARPGRKLKISRRDYPKLVEWSDLLFPVLLKLLVEIRSSTPLPLRDRLRGLEHDYPQACRFLIHHLTRLESALRNSRLRARAAGLESRAQLLADALAGADYKLSLQTSVERTREGRRMMHRSAL